MRLPIRNPPLIAVTYMNEPQTLLRLAATLREGERTLAEPKKASEFAFLVNEPQTLLRLAATLREG